MLDVRPIAYVTPIAEQEIGPLTPVIRVQNFADEDAVITGLVRIYQKSTGLQLYHSVLAITALPHGTTLEIAALTPWNPGAPADDDYFILAQVEVWSLLTAISSLVPLGQYFFDIKPAPMGPVPATHHTTHEFGGMDPIDVTNMPGLLADQQVPTTHALEHELGGSDPINVGDLSGVPLQSKPQTLTDQAAIDWDLNSGGVAKITLGGDRILNNPTHMVQGSLYFLRVIQDSTGNRTLTPGNAYRTFFGLPWVALISTTPDCIDIFGFLCDGSHMDLVIAVQGISVP